ncbi:MAG: stage 0 sporulation protein, partial [Clostridia bacterium]|nr:stage 0 sporulation protein [Clostridia bacterium]
CGRLMCCLKYEQDTYEELIKNSPSVGVEVQTPEGKGTVEYVGLLQGYVNVRIDNEDEKVLKQFNVDEVEVIKQ